MPFLILTILFNLFSENVLYTKGVNMGLVNITSETFCSVLRKHYENKNNQISFIGLNKRGKDTRWDVVLKVEKKEKN